MKIAFLVIVFIYLLINLIAYPIQYRYVESLEELKAKGFTQREIYDSMAFSEINIHAIAQSPLFLLANIVAYRRIKYKQKQSIEA